MPTTDEQVDNKRRDVEQLREDIASTVAEISRRQRELDNDKVMGGLEAEEERLLVELETHQVQLETLGGGATTSSPGALPVKATPKSTDGSTNGKG